MGNQSAGSFRHCKPGAVQEKVSTGLMAGTQYIATHALSIGQSTFDFIANLFVMLYLLFSSP